MVTVGVPIAVFKILGRAVIDGHIAAVVLVKPAYNVKQCCFAATRLTEHGNKLVFTELNAYSFQRLNLCVAGRVAFNNIS